MTVERSVIESCTMGRTSSAFELGVFHLGALQLLVHADVGAEIVIFVVIGGQDGGPSSKKARTETLDSTALSMPSCSSNTSCGKLSRKAALRGQSAVQVQRDCV